MTIQAGDHIPEAVLQTIDEGVEQVDTRAFFHSRKVVVFGVPGAFTPTCSERHLPSYVANYPEFIRRGIEVACVSVNDPFVMQAWGESQHVPRGLHLLADGNGDFTRAMGLAMDASAYGMGLRSKRYALYAEDGIVGFLAVEAPGEFRVSSAEHVLDRITRDFPATPLS